MRKFLSVQDRQKRRRLIGISVSAFLVVLIVLLGYYVSFSHAKMKAETERSISESASLIMNLIELKSNSTLDVLKTACTDSDAFASPETALVQLKKMNSSNDFTRLCYTDADGTCYTSDNQVLNAADMDFYRQIVSGANEAISCNSGLFAENDKSVVFSIPVRDERGTLSGIVSACHAVDKIQETQSHTYFDAHGYRYIIRRDGTPLMRSDTINGYSHFDNFFSMVSRGGGDDGCDIEKLKADMADGKSGIFYFHFSDGIKNIMQYTPVEGSDWYLLSIVPTEYAQATMRSMLFEKIGISVLIVLLFIALIAISIFISGKNSHELSKLAFIDPVTQGNSNLRFELLTKEAIEKAPEKTYCLILADIKQFKLINDLAGSENGDKTLKYCYETIVHHLRNGEFAGRNSADIFEMLILNEEKEPLIRRLNAIASDINKFNDTRDDKYYIPLRCGIYHITDKTLNFTTIYDRANIARKVAKKNQTDELYTVSFYDDTERIRQNMEKDMGNRMRKALETGEFSVFLQPKINLHHNNTQGAEALVRWKYNNTQLLQPVEFIPLFERNGFITQLDKFVFEQACKIIKNWTDHEMKPIQISINLSQLHLKNPCFFTEFVEISKKYNLPPKLIEFEFTESVAFENMENLAKIIDQMHENGFTCSLDDFGSGYSSLNILSQLSVDTIKLDREFFRDSNFDNTRSKKIIASIVNLAKELGVTTVAEGIESMKQVEFLKSIGCDMVQGFVFSEPVPHEEFIEFMKKLIV